MFTHSSYLEIFLFFLFSIYSHGYVDYTGSTELIQQRVGNDLKLHCDLKGLVDDEKLKNIKIHWFFKQCGENSLHLKNCHHTYEDDDWLELPCENYFCKPDLYLRNVTENYSGLYKCTLYPHERTSNSKDSLDIQLVRTYQVDVKNTSTTLPEFIDYYPTNKSAILGTQVVFQCRVRSEVHPTIKWFKRLSARTQGLENFVYDNSSSGIIHYNGHRYELLPLAQQKFISDETYLSKLIINNVRWQDEGNYACVAVNYRGFRMQLFHLSVMAGSDETEYFADYDEENVKTDPLEFFLLFLIPLSLAMLPLSVWLIYRIYKNRRTSKNLARKKLQSEQVSPEMRRILVT